MKQWNILMTLLSFIAVSCHQEIKNNNAEVHDEVIESSLATPSSFSDSIHTTNNFDIRSEEDINGYWVGDFEMANKDSEDKWGKVVAKDEGLIWNRNNKINISINKMDKGKVYGHSVVAGNHRPFEGAYNVENGKYSFVVREPGDDRYDGTFTFEINLGERYLSGTWKAYKNIDVKNRVYHLEKKIFHYNPDQELVEALRYANWDKEVRDYFQNEIDEESFMDFRSEFESATEEIYKYNASNTLLTKDDVENLKQGDLFIIRNTIYARHGYSFKNRPLRIFFDAQEWYIPVHNNIKKDLTSIEKENIKLLMKYEKNAKTYYDYFGRG